MTLVIFHKQVFGWSLNDKHVIYHIQNSDVQVEQQRVYVSSSGARQGSRTENIQNNDNVVQTYKKGDSI